ncbi:RsmD family RNA methyltransferase [Candidatus Tokpelaia sp.]|uniref:RsmD family RNA methyltransferase n=1 Tax=Candidatus Tokpelaia sp. TaxID=2233777 RepID=UPI003CC7C60A
MAAAPASMPEVPFAFPAFTGELPSETVPLILETRPTRDYALIDSGFGKKLERYGALHIIRPEGQALWPPALPEREWAQADAVFTGNLEEEGVGRWQFPQAEKHYGKGAIPAETWPLQWRGLPFLGRFTSFRHVGVFPEQEAHWLFMEQLIKQAGIKGGPRPRVLNLFGYTGLASLIAARAGAEVVHIDASRKAIGWAQENQLFAKMADAPIRWICEDALKFMRREQKRNSFYDIILLDPPAYGRGPKGEIWQFFDHIAELTARARALLSPQPLAVILTAYSIRASFYALHTLMRESFRGCNGRVESGELILREAGLSDKGENRPDGRQKAGRVLSTSLFSRWVNII